eukprot:1391696-Amorphochlora_amoeboformis.AAC.2
MSTIHAKEKKQGNGDASPSPEVERFREFLRIPTVSFEGPKTLGGVEDGDIGGKERFRRFQIGHMGGAIAG